VEEGQIMEDIVAEDTKPITKLPRYIPLRKGKAKITKDPDSEKFTISTPLLPEHVPFEGPRHARIPLLKMEDWDLEDRTNFPNLVIDNFMKHVHYEETGVTVLEMEEWVCDVEQSRFLNLLWVPHYHRTPINTICVCQLLTLVNDGFLWLGGPIPITDMLIHGITHLPHEGLNPAKEFGGKTREKELFERMKKDSELVKKPCGYSISFISDPAVQLAAQILVGKVMRKCHADEVLVPVMSLAA